MKYIVAGVERFASTWACSGCGVMATVLSHVPTPPTPNGCLFCNQSGVVWQEVRVESSFGSNEAVE